MYKMDGDNQFDNGVYDERRWSAPVIQSPEELAGYLRAADIPGRRLTGVRCVGPAYNFTREWLESLAFTAAMANTDPEKAFPPLAEYLPEDTVFNRLLLTDKPVVLEFDTGDSLAVDFSRPAEVRMALNSIPAGVQMQPGCDNVDTAVLFSEVLGKHVLGLQIGRRRSLPEDWPQPSGEEWKEQETLIAFLLFQMEDGVGLAFEPFRDTGRVFVIDQEKKIHTISYGELKPALRPDAYTPPEQPETED